MKITNIQLAQREDEPIPAWNQLTSNLTYGFVEAKDCHGLR
jgi:hypothetical protein